MDPDRPTPEFLATDNFLTGKELYLLELFALDDWPFELELLSRHFGLFLALDARQVPDAAIRKVARRCLDSGLAYVCTWGPDCERVRELFDVMIEERFLPASGGSVRTSARGGEALDEALWFFINSAYPDAAFDDCRAWVAVAVDAPSWTEEIRARLRDPEKLSNDLMRRL